MRKVSLENNPDARARETLVDGSNSLCPLFHLDRNNTWVPVSTNVEYFSSDPSDNIFSELRKFIIC
jgi:hypothetical protein